MLGFRVLGFFVLGSLLLAKDCGSASVRAVAGSCFSFFLFF